MNVLLCIYLNLICSTKSCPSTSPPPLQPQVAQEHEVFRRERGKAFTTLTHWDAHADRYVARTVPEKAATHVAPLEMAAMESVALETSSSSPR